MLEMEVDIKDKNLVLLSHYNVIELKNHFEKLGTFKQVNMDSFWVKNFISFFLLRYALFCISLVTLQYLHVFQIWVLLGI